MVPKDRRNGSNIHRTSNKLKEHLQDDMIERPMVGPEVHRVHWLLFYMCVMVVVIVARLWFLQIVEGPQLASASIQQQTRKIVITAPRGVIEDRYGKVLATSRSRFDISVTPNDIAKNPKTLPRLAKLLSLDLHKLNEEVSATLKGPARYTPLTVLKNADLHQLANVDERILDLPGVLVNQEPVRWYTDDSICTPILGLTRPIDAAQLKKLAPLGYLGGDKIGIMGLEKTYEHYLRGKQGEEDFAVDARGRLLRPLGEIKPVPGDTLQLALDFKLQRIAAEALHNTGHPGAVVAINPNTGGVLAMASMPTYNLNYYGKNFTSLLNNPLHPLINRASGSSYPCGSTFKMVTASAGLMKGSLTTDTRYYCPGYLELGGRKFHCDSVHGSIGFYRAIGESCNVFFFHVAIAAGHTAIANMARQYGLGEKTGIDLPVDEPGLIPTTAWKKRHGMIWLPGDTLNMAIGQGYDRVTPLQLACYVAAVGNGGTLWTPRLVDSIINPVTGEAQAIPPKVHHHVDVSPEYLQDIIKGMELVTSPNGTAPGAAIPGFPYAAKTGTAQVWYNGKESDNSVFVCFAPINHPTIAIAVLVERDGYGGVAAGGVAKRMLMSYFHLGGNAKPATATPPTKLALRLSKSASKKKYY